MPGTLLHHRHPSLHLGALLVAFTLVVIPTAPVQAAERALNGGFEEGSDTVPSGWSVGGGALTRVSAPVTSGNYAAEFHSADHTSKTLYQVASVRAENRYIFSAQILKNDPAVAEAYLRISWYAVPDGFGPPIRNTESTSRITQDNPSFRALSTGEVSPPPGAESARLSIVLVPVGSQAARIYADDVSFMESSYPSATATSSPSATTAVSPSSTVGPTATNTSTATRTATQTRTPTKTAAATSTAVRTASATRTPSATRTLTPLVTGTPTRASATYSTRVVLNEFLSYPSQIDWNGDGLQNSDDEWIELYNGDIVAVDLTGWRLTEGSGAHYTIPATLIGPGQFRYFFGSKTRLRLNNDGDQIRLLRPDAVVADAWTYSIAYRDESWARTIDGAGEWARTSSPTIGYANLITQASTKTPVPAISAIGTPAPAPSSTWYLVWPPAVPTPLSPIHSTFLSTPTPTRLSRSAVTTTVEPTLSVPLQAGARDDQGAPLSTSGMVPITDNVAPTSRPDSEPEPSLGLRVGLELGIGLGLGFLIAAGAFLLFWHRSRQGASTKETSACNSAPSEVDNP